MNRLTDEQQALAGDPVHVQLALSLGRRLASRCPWRSADAESHALYGLCVAAATYDASHVTTFRAWLYRKVRFAVADGLRDEDSFRKACRNDVKFTSLRRDIDSDDLPVGWEIASQDTVERFIRSMPARHANIIRSALLHCESGGTFSDAAVRAGKNVNTVLSYLNMVRRWVAAGEFKELRDD